MSDGVDRTKVVIAQFAKEPILGEVKTRMAPRLNLIQALSLHKSLVSYTVQQIADFPLATLELWVGSNGRHEFFQSLSTNTNIAIYEQHGDSLGDKMYFAAVECLQRAEAVIIIGSDCPFISKTVLTTAIHTLLAGVPVVINPAFDGGYVLIGFTKVAPEVFAGVQWGSETVLQQTRDNMTQLGWRWHELDTLSDIDRPTDLQLLPADFQF